MKWIITAVLLVVATGAAAEPVNPQAANGIACRYVNESNLYVLCADSRAFVIGGSFSGSTWTLIEDQFPVAVDHMADWTPYFIVSDTGELWKGSPQISNDDWVLAPPLQCDGPVPNQGQSLGGVKSLFR